MKSTIVEILIDKSGSMGAMTRVPENVGDYKIDGETRMSIIKKVLIEDVLPSIEDYAQKIFIRTFRGTAKTKSNINAEGLDIELIYSGEFKTKEIEEIINNLSDPPSGGTPITAVLNMSYHNLQKFPNLDRKIILLTDGEENGDGNYLIAAKNINSMLGISCKIFVIGLALEGTIEQNIKSIATGGFVNIKSKDVIEKDIKKIFEPLKIAVLTNAIANLNLIIKKERELRVTKLISSSELDSTTLTIDEEYSEHIRLISESYIYNILCEKYGKSFVKWLNQVSESNYPYDFQILGSDSKYIEVKGTIREKPTFYLTANEWNFFLENKDHYEIYRVTNCHDDKQITYFHISNLLSSLLSKEIVPYLLAPEILKEERVHLTIKNILN